MKCMVIVLLAFVAVGQALSFGIGGDIGLGDGILDEGIGEGLGGEGIGGYHAGGADYGHSGYAGGRRGYGARGYGHGVLSANHNLGHNENDFSQEVHHHSVSDHNVGGVLQEGGHGHAIHGYGAYGRGGRGYGRRFDRGGYGV